MKKILILVVCIIVMACTDNSESEKKSSSVNQKMEVELAIKKLNETLINPQNAQFDKIVTKGLSYGHSSGNIQNKDEFIDDLKNGPFDIQEITISDQTIDVFDQTAIVRHILSAKAKNAGEAVEFSIGIFLVFQKKNDHWKLRARQAYKL